MGIKDEGKDKDELKNLVENSVEKKLKEFSKDTEKNREKDKKEILKELKQRDEKGLNTLAQKFEMLKLKAEQANKKQSKNPLVELSDKNLKWLSEHAAVNKDKNASIVDNIFKTLTKKNKKQDKETEQDKEDKKVLFSLPYAKGEEEPVENKSQADAILKSKLSMSEKIDEIHDFVVRGVKKEQEKSTNILSKGLKGLNGVLKNTHKIMGELADNGAKIASIVGLGALGLLYIVGWFKEGGPGKLAAAIKDNIIPAITEAVKKGLAEHFGVNIDNPDTGSELDRYTNAAESAKSVHSAAIDSKDVTLDRLKNIAGTVTKVGKQETRNMSDLQREGLVDRGIGLTYIDSKWNEGKMGYDIQYKEMENENPVIFKLPFPVTIKDIAYGTSDKKHCTITIERKRKLANPRVMITKVLDVLFPKGTDIPKDTPIAIVDSNFQILGDWNKFMNTEGGYIDYAKYWSDADEKYVNNYATNKTDEIQEKHMKQAKSDQKWQNYYKNLTVADTVTGAAIDKVSGAINGEDTSSTKQPKTEVPKADVTQVSENKETINKQAQDIQKPTSAAPTQQQGTQNTQQNNQQQPSGARSAATPSGSNDIIKPNQFPVVNVSKPFPNANTIR